MKQELDKRVADGLIKAISNGHLTLYNYTNQCVCDKQWDEYTMMARGLVLNNQTGEVVARPWAKFFNLGERPGDPIPAEVPELSNKYDGSLIIVFYDTVTATWKAVTRGSWDNKQTEHAYDWLDENAWRLGPGTTYLFELVAPWNRIVVKYLVEDMVLIGIVATLTGEDCTYHKVRDFALEHGLTPAEFHLKKIESLKLDDPTVKNEEGFVARFSNGYRVKVKYKQYVYLHKILTGMSIKGVWEMLSTGGSLDLDGLPDDFIAWFRKERDKIQQEFLTIERRVRNIFDGIGHKNSRKEYAAEFLKHKPITTALFLLLDGNDYHQFIWKLCKPERHKVFKVECTE